MAKAADILGLKTSREFPELTAKELRQFLVEPSILVRQWWEARGGQEKLTELVKNHHFKCDGWIAFLAFLPQEVLWSLKDKMAKAGVLVQFVATTRDVTTSVRSELQPWVVHDIER